MNMTMLKRFLLSGGSAALALGMLAPAPAAAAADSKADAAASQPDANAQQVPGTAVQQAAAQNAAAPPSTGAEIVVTARKRADPIQRVPQSVTALSGAQLNAMGAQSIEDYFSQVPGLNFISTGNVGEHELVLRGVTAGVSGSPTVGIYVDDVPYGSSSQLAEGGLFSLDLLPFDMDHIEVLRGPQGTLYGANTLGGLLKYVTNQPNSQAFEGDGQLDLSKVEDGGWGGGGKLMLNIPLAAGKAALRVSGYDEVDPGWIQNVGLGKRDVNRTMEDGIRAALLFTPTSSLSIKLSVLGQHISNRGTSFEDVDVDTHVPIFGDLKQSRIVPEFLRQKYWQYAGTVTLDTPIGQLISVSSYSTLNSSNQADETLGLGFPSKGTNVASTKKTTEELRLVSRPGTPIEWLVGAFYTHENSNQEEDFEAVGPPFDAFNPLLHVHFPSHLTEEAVFGDLTWHATSKFDITLGARGAHNKQSFVVTETGAFAGAVQPGNSSNTTWTWLVNPAYHFTKDVMLYGRFATGYRPGGPNVLPPEAAGQFPATFGPDKTNNYEIGLKGSFLQHRLVFDVAAYDVEWKNIQLIAFINGFSGLANGKGARSRGIEFAAEARPAAGLTLSLNGAYTNAKLTGDAPAVGGADGNVVPLVPKFSGSANADYDFPVGGKVRGFGGMSFRFAGRRQASFVGNPAAGIDPVSAPFTLRSYGLLDFHAGVTDGRWRLTAFLKNATNKRAELTATTSAPGSGNPAELTVIQPRTFGLTLARSF
jgi:iron complex outermembrane recepter protein